MVAMVEHRGRGGPTSFEHDACRLPTTDCRAGPEGALHSLASHQRQLVFVFVRIKAVQANV